MQLYIFSKLGFVQQGGARGWDKVVKAWLELDCEMVWFWNVILLINNHMVDQIVVAIFYNVHFVSKIMTYNVQRLLISSHSFGYTCLE